MNLPLSHSQSLPLNVVTEKLAWIGVTGSGKSYGASKLAELLWTAHAQFVVLDPVGVWYGLRLAKDGKNAGALIADLIVDRDLSVVLDVSQFESDAQKARFVSDFSERFYHRKKAAPSAVHLFLEEAQEFVPQNPQRGEEIMLHRLHRLQKLGRNFGIGTSIITQRPQETSKKALNQAQTVFAFRLTGPQERKAIEGWISEKGLERDILAGLPAMNTGDCHIWSPSWLKVFKVARISPKDTFDASATPKVGERRAARALAPIDLEKLRTEMAATIEKAKLEDPKILWKEITRLKFELAEAKAARGQVHIEKAVLRKTIEVPILRGGELNRLEKLAARFDKHVAKAGLAHDMMRDLSGTIAATIAAAKRATAPSMAIPFAPISDRAIPPHRPAVPEAPRTAQEVIPGVVAITPARQRILNALRQFEFWHIKAMDKGQAAFFSNASPKSSAYANNLGALRSGGMIEYVGGLVTLTPAGRGEAKVGDRPLSSIEIQQQVLGKLEPARSRMLAALLNVHPGGLSKESLAEKAGASVTSSAFANNLGALRTLGVVEKKDSGYGIRATKLLFVEPVAA